jgi:hypothetical protein
MRCFAQSPAETRHNLPLAFTMQQGPVPTQLCCGTSKLGGARLTRMKESHEVYEIRQGTSDERPLCWRHPQRYVLRRELYTVGFLYVTGTVTAQSGGNGIISGFKIDHNTGKLTHQWTAHLFRRRQPGSRGPAHRQPLPLCSQPRRQLAGGRLHHGRSLPELQHHRVCGGRQRHPHPAGDLLHPGHQSLPDDRRPSGNFLYVLDHDSPQEPSGRRRMAALALGAGVTTCGDITAFQINQTTGRLSADRERPGNGCNGAALPYFPVPANPIDFVALVPATSSP